MNAKIHSILRKSRRFLKKLQSYIKKKKAAAFVFVCFFFCVLLLLLLLFLCGIKAACIGCAAILLCMFLALAVNDLSKRWVSKEKPASYFKNLHDRNMDGLLLGSTKVWKYLRDLPSNIYACPSYRRSLQMDFAMLKTYHSHVSEGGKVFLIVDYAEAVRLQNLILPRDFSYVHPQIFLEMKVKEKKRRSRYPLLYYPLYTLGYIKAKILRKIGWYRHRTWKYTAGKNMHIHAEEVCTLASLIDQMLQFCWERKLNPVLFLLNGNPDNNCANEIIKAYLAPKHYFFDPLIVSDADELNALLKL